MKKYFILILLLCSVCLQSQIIDSKWKIYLSYSSYNIVEESSDKVYCVASGALFSYDKEDNSVRVYNKNTGLNDTDISFMNYNQTTKSLLLVYSNGNIDILENEGVTNIPYLYNNTQLTNKTVYSVYLYNEYAYIATGFGIVVVNMNKKEIKETYNLGMQINSCCIKDNIIYAATKDEVYYCSVENNLMDKSLWEKLVINNTTITGINRIFILKNELGLLVTNGIYYGDDYSKFINLGTVTNNKIANDKLVIVSSVSISNVTYSYFTAFTDLNNPERSKNYPVIGDVYPSSNNEYWIAFKEEGLTHMNRSETFSMEYLTVDGPYVNSAFKLVFNNNQLYSVPGGTNASGERLRNYGYFIKYDFNEWTYFHGDQIGRKFGIYPSDFNNIAIDPEDETNIFISSFGHGVFQIKDMEPVAVYNFKNSPIEVSLQIKSNDENTRLQYQNIDGLIFDNQGTLWMTNSEANEAIKAMDRNGKWDGFPIVSLINTYNIGDIYITKNNHKWINVQRADPKIVVWDDNGTLDDTGDDTIISYTSFTDQDGESFTTSGYLCMTEDKDGYLWVGTKDGPIYFENPANGIDNEARFRCTRIKMSRDGELYYFLNSITVLTIAVDNANRKWIGTNGNGIYVLNDTNDEIVHEFTTANSPLISDVIYSITFNEATGEVFIGTDKGIVSYQGEAIKGKEDFSNVYAYPNPVRPEFHDQVTITGLMDNTNVKITDINGNIIFQTKSLGGQAFWNCRNHAGKRVASGVYLVLGTTPEAGESVVTKIAVVK